MTDDLRAQVLDPKAMDLSVRPQDDFFRYVNGAWLDSHVIPGDRAADGAFHQLRDLSEENCHAIVLDAVDGKIPDPDADRIAILFQQFMDEKAVNAAGASPLVPLLGPVFAATDHEELAAVAGKLGTLGIGAFFSDYVSTDLNDSSRYILYFNQAGLGLPDESYYREDKYAQIRDKYLRYIETMFTLAAVESITDVALAAQEVLDFETTLASHHWDVVRDREVEQQNNPRQWDDILNDYPQFAWETWAQAQGLNPGATPVVNVNQPDYLAAGAKLWADTPLSTLKLWYARKIIGAYAPYLSDLFVLENFDFYSRTLAGVEELRPRWKRGLGLVEGVVGEALGRLYVERHFPAEYKARMDKLVNHLLDAYRSSITDLDWMTDATRAEALQKLDTFVPKIGHPDQWRDYSRLHISADNTLVENVTAAQKFETEWQLSRLGQPVDRNEWFMTPQTVNAYYNPTMNEIVFPAAILQPPFFNPAADDAVNFAAIGAVIGHEIGHGFDDQGSQFDANGEMRNWWSDQDREEFERRTRSLIEQYDRYVPTGLDPEHHVNGGLTIGENIGDLGGLTIAWKAWVAALAQQGLTPQTAPEIDGLSAIERFFTSWAVIWKGKKRPEFAVQLLAVDPHSPDEFRCNGVLANFDEFATYYDVKEGDALWTDPSDRVRIW